MADPSTRDALARMPICRGLSPAEVAELAGLVEPISAGAGEWLFREGEVGDALFLIVVGHVEIVKHAGPEELSLARVGEGAILGEMSLVVADHQRSASGRALTDVRGLRLPAARFEVLLRKESLAALKIVAAIARVLSRRLALMNDRLFATQQKPDAAAPRGDLAEFQKILQVWSF